MGPADVPLNDGSPLPAVGLGTAGLTGPAGVEAMLSALDEGYRLLDTAVGYGNEAETGEALRRSAVPAGDVVVTSKLPASGHGYDAARRSIEQSRHALGIKRIGPYLIHWPNPSLGRYVETWQALVAAREDGEVVSIGVSNFNKDHLAAVIDGTGVVPAVNQIEVHPHFPRPTYAG